MPAQYPLCKTLTVSDIILQYLVLMHLPVSSSWHALKLCTFLKCRALLQCKHFSKAVEDLTDPPLGAAEAITVKQLTPARQCQHSMPHFVVQASAACSTASPAGACRWHDNRCLACQAKGKYSARSHMVHLPMLYDKNNLAYARSALEPTPGGCTPLLH